MIAPSSSRASAPRASSRLRVSSASTPRVRCFPRRVSMAPFDRARRVDGERSADARAARTRTRTRTSNDVDVDRDVDRDAASRAFVQRAREFIHSTRALHSLNSSRTRTRRDAVPGRRGGGERERRRRAGRAPARERRDATRRGEPAEGGEVRRRSEAREAKEIERTKARSDATTRRARAR